MPHAIRVHEAGGPEVLQWEEVEVGAPGSGQVRIRQEAAGRTAIHCLHFGRGPQSEDKSFLVRLAAENRGTYVYIGL